MDFFFPMKRRGGVMPSKYFLRKEGVGVVPSCMRFMLPMQKTKVILKLFPTKRRGGVMPSRYFLRKEGVVSYPHA